MGIHRDLAVSAMKIMSASSAKTDFMAQAGIPMPDVIVPGSLPAMARDEVPASKLLLSTDLVMNWTIGDFGGRDVCSSYYNPNSPWYNVLYGSYGLRSYKTDGTAWGYRADGSPDFDEFLKIAEIDYNFFTAGQFGCPPEKMSFAVHKQIPGSTKGWDSVEVEATIPSGLHDPRVSLGSPGTYVVYGIPKNSFLKLREAYEPVAMRGRLYMRQIPQAKLPQPITLAFGVICPKTHEGRDLLNVILAALCKAFFPIGHKTGSLSAE